MCGVFILEGKNKNTFSSLAEKCFGVTSFCELTAEWSGFSLRHAKWIMFGCVTKSFKFYISN